MQNSRSGPVQRDDALVVQNFYKSTMNLVLFALHWAWRCRIGISLSLGLFTRLGSMLAILRAFTNILVAGGAGPDTVGFNVMLMVAGAIGLNTGAGRRFVDSLLLARWPSAKLLRLVA
jgi:TQO small subunit DoxD